ncbi:MAG: PEP-CTERM sorting domain-containing protein [Microcystis aeruginosa BK11-02]|nr:PEP-CTERM sorting domain-containing protein [Microcystis aeruginosa BK11-02]
MPKSGLMLYLFQNENCCNFTVYASNTSQVPVPEPSAVLSLLALGGLGLVSLKRKQN